MGEGCSPEVRVLGEFRCAEVRVLGESRPAEVRVLGEFRCAEVHGLGEGYPAEVRVLGEFRYAEVRVLGESRPVEVRGLGKCRFPEVRLLGEGCSPEVRFLGESSPAEVRFLGESRPAEVRVAVELGRRKITFLNREGTERIENGSSAEIEIKVTPDSWNGFDYFTLIILGEDTTALAHLDEDSAAYVLFFVELCIVCGDVFRFFVFIRIFETLKQDLES